MSRWGTLIAGALVLSALLACKKSDDEAAPTASAAPEPAPTPAASVTAEPSAEPAASASAEPTATTAAADTPAPTVTAKPTASASADAAAPKVPQNTTSAFNRISSCCGALSTEAGKGGMTANRYKAAAAVCSGIAQQVKKGAANESAARTLIRAQLQGEKSGLVLEPRMKTTPVVDV